MEGALLHLQPAAESRRVVWTSDDGKRLAVAMVPANARRWRSCQRSKPAQTK